MPNKVLEKHFLNQCRVHNVTPQICSVDIDTESVTANIGSCHYDAVAAKLFYRYWIIDTLNNCENEWLIG